MEKHRASERAIVAALAELIARRLTQTPLQRLETIWRNQAHAVLRPAARLFTH